MGLDFKEKINCSNFNGNSGECTSTHYICMEIWDQKIFTKTSHTLNRLRTLKIQYFS